MPETWYVVRTAPGAQRPDRRDDRFTRLEIDLYENGIDCYQPMEMRDIIHHRSKKLITKSFPLIPGYAFVTGVTNFWALSECKTVSGVLGIEGSPMTIMAKEIEAIREAERSIFEELATQRRRRAMARQRVTRRTLAGSYPSGTPVVVSAGFLANERGMVQATAGRGKIRLTLERFANLGTIELAPSDVRIDETRLVSLSSF